jgi:hypothetical protein
MAKENTAVAEKDTAAALELEKLKAENEALRTKLGTNFGKTIPGTYTVNAETPDGEAIAGDVYQFTPGHVRLLLPSGDYAESAAFMKVVNGEDLSVEESSRNAALVKLGRDGSVAFINRIISRGTRVLQKVALMAMLLILFSVSLSAQFRSGTTKTFVSDTVGTGETLTYTVPQTAVEYDQYAYIYQIPLVRISGSSAGSVYVEESLYATGSQWFRVDTVTVANATSQTLVFSGTMQGVRQRILYVPSTTGSIRTITPIVRIRQRKY